MKTSVLLKEKSTDHTFTLGPALTAAETPSVCQAVCRVRNKKEMVSALKVLTVYWVRKITYKSLEQKHKMCRKTNMH